MLKTISTTGRDLLQVFCMMFHVILNVRRNKIIAMVITLKRKKKKIIDQYHLFIYIDI